MYFYNLKIVLNKFLKFRMLYFLFYSIFLIGLMVFAGGSYFILKKVKLI